MYLKTQDIIEDPNVTQRKLFMCRETILNDNLISMLNKELHKVYSSCSIGIEINDGNSNLIYHLSDYQKEKVDKLKYAIISRQQDVFRAYFPDQIQ